MADHDFAKLVADAKAKFDALSPEEQAAHREAQRQSWVRGEMGMKELAVMVKPMADQTDRQRAFTPKAIEAALDAVPGFKGWRTLQLDDRLRVRDDMSRALTAADAAMEAAGWVRVPVEPTEAMREAAKDARSRQPAGTTPGISMADAYRAMIAARPTGKG